ncbi:MAG: carboxypeptidase-like regulatory domain-containing protein [bacterium]|nr:carboxypeptidase-like regulatory domain-containing protein [bacterium]
MKAILSAAALLALLVTAGCGGYDNVAPVTGVVTLDGAPLPNARIVFSPVKGGRPSEATSDADGNYSLRYTVDVDGAEIGEHKVSVTTSISKDTPRGPVNTPELVPARYNARSELNKEVSSSTNEINLQLEGE